MIFGRKKRRLADEEEPLSPSSPEVVDDTADDTEGETPDQDEVDDADIEDDDAEESDDDEDDSEDDDEESDEDSEDDEDDEDEDESPLLVDHSLRDDGPFDLSEVDLEADEIERFDFGALIVTPTEGQLDVQVDQSSSQPFAVVQRYQESAIEVALFAAPASSLIVGEQIAEIAANHEQQGATAKISEGPFGAQVHTSVPVQTDDGREGYVFTHWILAQGPKWMLRGRIMGAAGFEHERDEESAEVLMEFFRNIVVRRDDDPMVPGELIPLTLPESLLPSEAGDAPAPAEDSPTDDSPTDEAGQGV